MFFIKDLTKLDVGNIVDATFDIKDELRKLGLEGTDKRVISIVKKLNFINSTVLDHQNNLNYLLKKQGY